MAPLEDKLIEILPQNKTVRQELVQTGRIQAMPINYLRGASWKNKVVIADEAQNFTFKELITLITRLGNNSKLFICGDFMQSDINGKTGYRRMFDVFKDNESSARGIHTFSFNKEDILRSHLQKFIITRLEREILTNLRTNPKYTT
jgi:phosphate starvation-inducible PhoH-like protein